MNFKASPPLVVLLNCDSGGGSGGENQGRADRGWELRFVAGAGLRFLPPFGGRLSNSGDHAPRPRRLPYRRYRICRRLRHRKGKVGRDLCEAVAAPPNNTERFAAVRPTGVEVRRGPTHDGIGRYLREIVIESSQPVDDVAGTLRRTGAEIVVSYLPVGSEPPRAGMPRRHCAPAAAMSTASRSSLQRMRNGASGFVDCGLPLIGDDIKSQVGATIVHRVLANLFRERGVRVDRTYQLNFGGNTDFQNMLERERLQSKKRSKTDAVVEPARRRNCPMTRRMSGPAIMSLG